MSRELSQATANWLLELEKVAIDQAPVSFPSLGGKARAELVAPQASESFILDVWQGGVVLQKISQQLRARQTLVLLRLDLGSVPHRNPDGQEIICPHLHIYREGWGDRWAYELPPELAESLSSPRETLYAFMAYCHIVEPPNFTFNLLNQ